MQFYLAQSDILIFDKRLESLIPDQRDYIDQLMDDERIIMYTVSADRSTWCCIIKAASEREARDILAGMPIIEYLDPKIHELMFLDFAEMQLPRISLN